MKPLALGPLISAVARWCFSALLLCCGPSLGCGQSQPGAPNSNHLDGAARAVDLDGLGQAADVRGVWEGENVDGGARTVDASSGPEAGGEDNVLQNIPLNFLYIHGVQSSSSGKSGAANALADLEASVNSALATKIAAYRASHPSISIVAKSARASLYTATPSPLHPSDSTGPLSMDDWTVGASGCTTTKQGQPCTAAYEWRWRLKSEILSKFGPSAQNLILIGHSTGARAAMEVVANTGPDGMGTMDWGVQGMIVGVVTVHGMLDALNSDKYNVVGLASFNTTCSKSDLIASLFGDTAPGNGWCQYAGDISGFPSADWAAQNKYALMLVCYSSCSPSLWNGWSDGALPFDAQGSPNAIGVSMTAAPGQTYRPAYGVFYGSFCHSTITSRGDAKHAAAVTAATNQIVNWLFSYAPRVSAMGSVTTPHLSNNQSHTASLGSSCPTGRIDGSLAVAGVCRHPGWLDGDDHIVAGSELAITDGAACDGSFKWTQTHDSNNSHNAIFWWQTYSLPTSGGLIGTLAGH